MLAITGSFVKVLAAAGTDALAVLPAKRFALKTENKGRDDYFI